jgi:hypothetical protein
MRLPSLWKAEPWFIFAPNGSDHMKHITDFQDFKWFEIESREEAEADHAQTGEKGAFPFWGHTERGHTFYVLRDADDRTYLTTLVFKWGLAESKVNAGTVPDFHHDAVQALMAGLGISRESFIWGERRGPERQRAVEEEIAREEAEEPDDFQTTPPSPP